MNVSTKEIIQIDATVITGILILLTITPFVQDSLLVQSLEGDIDFFQFQNELMQLNETETTQYISELMKEQNELNRQFFTNPLFWASTIGIFFSTSALIATGSLIIKNGPRQVLLKENSARFMFVGFFLFLIMFYSFAVLS